MIKKTRSISVLLSLCLIVSMLTNMVPVSAVTTLTDTVTINTDYSDNYIAPDIIEKDELDTANYVGRVSEDEKDLCSFSFKNGDGSNTMRVFSHPVKYVDDTGATRDISLEITSNKDGSFFAAEHMIKANFGSSLANGIDLEYNAVKVSMKAFDANANVNADLSDDGKKLTYALDDKTSYVYSLTYLGIKEDIVVSEYTGQTEYEFTLDTNGLHPVKIDGSVFLADVNGEIKATIGDIIVFTADERNNFFGDLIFETIVENEEYVFTIILDADYLNNDKTAYPITIDPTIEINYDNNGAGAIEDVTINSLSSSNGSSGSLFVGLRETYGISRVLMRFPNLNLSSIPSADNIISASVELRDLMCESQSMITYCYPFTGNDWSESSVGWDTVLPNSYGSLLSSANISYSNGSQLSTPHRYSFDIKNAARGWKAGTFSPAKGLLFKASASIENGSTYINKTFSSYNRNVYKPSLIIVYSSNVSLNFSVTSIVEGGSKTLTATTVPSGQNISWSSSNNSVATVNSSGTVTAIKAGVTTITASHINEDGTISSASCTVYVYISNGVYYIQNKYTEYYLNVENGKINNLTNVYQYTKYSNSTPTSYRLRQMWKTHYLGNGLYSIRPMHKLNMALDVTGNNVDIYNIGTTDTLAGVPSYASWSIEWYSTGYIFKKGGSNEYALQVENASTTVMANIIADTFSSNLTRNRWNLERVTSPPSGLLLYNTSTGQITNNPTKTINPKDEMTLSQLNLVVAVYSGSTINQSVYWYSSNTSVATFNSSTGSITGKSPGTATITARKNISGTYYYISFFVKVNNNAVIIVPGIMGTELIAGYNNSNYSYGTKLWSQDLIDDYQSGDIELTDLVQRIVSLRCDSDGDSLYDVIPYNNTYGAANTYESLYNTLSNTYQNEYSIKFFAYDWRLSNAESASALNDYINSYDFDNVILVCHSMGGLVASGYLALGSAQRNKVETVITLGSPLLGTSVVPYLWGSEDVNVTGLLNDLGLPDWAETLIDLVALYYNPLDWLMGNFGSMYEMFPSEKYFDSLYADKTYLVTSFVGIGDLVISTYADTRQRLNSYLPHYNAALADSAEDFHDSLYINGEHITSYVNTYYIAGYGKQTVDIIEFNMWDWYIYEYTYDGDQMVAEWSATLGDRYSNKTFFAEDVSHVGLVANSNVKLFIAQLIQGNTSTSAFANIYDNMPQSNS